MSLKKGEEKELPMKGHTIHFDLAKEQARIIDRTFYIVNEDEKGNRYFDFYKGPIFGQIILADEINRATPKSQSALLEAMQEQKVTVFGTEYPLDPPFIVLATQNPLEHTEPGGQVLPRHSTSTQAPSWHTSSSSHSNTAQGPDMQ